MLDSPKDTENVTYSFYNISVQGRVISKPYFGIIDCTETPKDFDILMELYWADNF